jgi:PAS domain S-box-containing protein
LRASSRLRGFGATLLAAALILAGLHGLDKPEWPLQTIYLLRVSFEGLLEVAIGIAMTVLVLEAGRERTEELNEKLRRLTLITAAATQSFRKEKVLGEVLQHLVESLNASHGIVRLLEGQGESEALVICASVGYSQNFLEQFPRISAAEPWARKVLETGSPFLTHATPVDQGVRLWMEQEKLAALVLVRVPGKDAPLGVLGIGSSGPRNFETDEVTFLLNVANLLGLTIQNVGLFEEVAGAQRQWASTFDSIDDSVLVHDASGRIVRVNRALAQRIDCECDTIVGRPLGDVLGRRGALWDRCPYCEGVAGKAESLDATFGRYFLASNSDFLDPAGARLGTIHVLKDITEQHEAEAKFRRLFENVREGVFISTPEGRYLDFNNAFMHLLGYETREELMAVQDIASTNYAHPEERERLKKILRDHGEVRDFEFQLRRRDGELRTVVESSFAAHDAAGNVTAYQGFVLDVTERKQAEREIRRRNRELLALNAISQMLGQSLDLSEVLGRVIRQVVELFGADLGSVYLLDEATTTLKRVAAAGFRSEYARHLSPVRVSAGLIQHIRHVRATLLSPKSLPLPELFRDVERKEGVKDSHMAILWAKDRIIGALVVGCRTMREFSAAELNLFAAVGSQIAAAVEKTLLLEETQKAYENLRLTQEQLLQSEKMAAVGQLISGVAHELNNPLTAILGYSQLLESSEHVSPRGADYVEKLYKQALRTHRIVQNLLSFARQQKPQRRPVLLNQILEDTLVLREYDLKLNNISVHREYDSSLVEAAGDTHQLQQVFLNILNNAVDAILEKSGGGDIWIRTATAGSQLLVEITDSGSGVQDPLKVFDPFYTTKPVGKGTGLGLSICYGIIKEHGGEITVRNAPPRGATFTIFLPILVSESPSAEDQPSAEEPISFGRVLLVDDEEAVLELEQEILRGRCLEVRSVRTGREAVTFLEQETVDVIVTDMKMPGDISGKDLYGWIARHRPDLASRVVFTMSNAQSVKAREMLTAAGCPFVEKPFQIEEFLRAIRQVVAPVAAPLKP